ncbi:double-strand break repair protein AddB [Polycladidibacter stylochi]|uniref:double-strand break repair protein AddB n=1 Tax=Polycladidibacter stylochi TaxID=1807766 RepID=UPI000AAA18B3|nr:double-strand break repair protein AddB [Pseudovibrio stylochi]
MSVANIFSVSPDVPFLPSVLKALLDGELVPNFKWDNDPLSLANVTIYVPTRRAARVLPDVLRQLLGGQAVLLPSIRPLGDVEEDIQLIRGKPDGLKLPPAMAAMDRKMAMTRLVWAFKGNIRAQLLKGDKEEFTSAIPASAADAAWLAADLLNLMDEVQTEEADWEKLTGLVPEDHAAYWQMTLEFLQIVTKKWPEFLKAMGQMDPKERRSQLIRREAKQLVMDPPEGPVIIAGATGSFPATAELIKTVLTLEQGALILPGLDHDMDELSWQLLASQQNSRKISGHPQYSLSALLASLGVKREQIPPLGQGQTTKEQVTRLAIVNEALRPADTTEQWQEFFTSQLAQERAFAFKNVKQIVAKTQSQEALAIALCLREAVEEGKSCALVSPDRTLARRVAADLTRWQISVDDTAGRPLERTPPMVLCELTARLALHGLEPVSLLSLLKHPLTRLGFELKEIRASARALERGVLRGPQPRQGISGLKEAVRSARLLQQDARVPRWKKVVDEDWQAIDQLVDRLEAALAPLEQLLMESGDIPVEKLIRAHVEATLAVAQEPDGSQSELFKGENGEALATTLASLLEADDVGLQIPAEDWPGVFQALIAGQAVRSRLPADPRIHLLGPMEARLQHYDFVVLGGLNEGTWPQKTRNDPWLNRPMKGQIGLDPPERKIGTAAHDFLWNIGAKEVVLSRSQRVDGAPTVASRWLNRINTLAGQACVNDMLARGMNYVQLSDVIDRAPTQTKPAGRPEPKPAVIARPRQLSVTQVETLIRDPYEIYAKKVLRLDEVDPIGGEPNAADKGTIIHEALARFLDEWFEGPFDKKAVAGLLDHGRRLFAPLDAFPAIRALWWPRFERIAAAFVTKEADWSPQIYDRFLETYGTAAMQRPGYEFLLTGRADRIDLLKDQMLTVIDYKTGQPPTLKQVQTLFAPQLPLEVAMIRRGAFADLPASLPMKDLIYIHLNGSKEPVKLERRTPKDTSIDELAEEAWQRLEKLVAAYENPNKGYLSRARVLQERQWAGGYDHLARVDEWSLGVAGDEN